MLCVKPYTNHSGSYGCGQCKPCRINRRRLWQSRILLESMCHPENSFVTLTYSDENLPGDLQPRHLQLFFKRLRNTGEKVRYYAVGEYGDKTLRPHYHAAIFGLGPLKSDLVNKAWGLGFVHVGDLNKDSAAYLTGYISKKLTSPDDPRLNGRSPEFSRMSLRPAVGLKAAGIIAEGLMQKHSSNSLSYAGDVPRSVKYNGKDYPLGTYLQRKLRENVGWDSKMPVERAKALALEEATKTPAQLAERRQKRINGNLSAIVRESINASKRRM